MKNTEFDKKCICGPEFVCVRIIENCDELKVGNIYLPSTSRLNDRLAHCVIEDIGCDAAEKHGLVVGDYVLIDRLATFAHTAPVAILKYDSVIMKTNKDNTEHWPLRNMAFVEPEAKDHVTKVGNIYVPGYQDRLNIGTITKINIDEDKHCPFAVGDKVILTKGADIVELGTKTINIYKHDMIVAKVVD